jgi:SARP family transcriptional regulator, regulator of embCAB operon
VRYEILGLVRVLDDDGAWSIGARKVETLLVALLVRADQTVGVDALVTEIWGDSAPRRAIGGLHVYVSQLRKFLTRSGRHPDPIVTQPSGYLLRLGSDELDLRAFLHRIELGRAHARAGRHQQAATECETALALRRGPVLDDVRHGPIVGGFVTWLTEAHLGCMEMMVDAHLALGHHREMVGLLRSLTVEYPLRETFYRQLMLALHRSQRRADALLVYQSAQRRLEDELGNEPCRALQDLHLAIVRGGELELVGAGLIGAGRDTT